MFVVFDLETTGLSSLNSDIIECAYILFDSSNMAVHAETLYFYYEGMSWSEEAYNVHKIPLEFLKQHADEFRTNLIKMYTILSNADVVGHNSNQFDVKFAINWLYKFGLNLNIRSQSDTMIFYRPITKRPRIKLTTLSDMMGFKPDLINYWRNIWFGDENESRAHEASYDVAATALLTLNAINKGLISFNEEEKKSTAAAVSNEDIEDMMDIENKQANTYPLVFCLCDDNTSRVQDINEVQGGSMTYHRYNTNRAKIDDTPVFPTVANDLIGTTQLLPIPLYKVSDGIYTNTDSHGIVYTLDISNVSDEFTMDNGIAVFTAEQVNIPAMIQNTFLNEGGVNNV